MHRTDRRSKKLQRWLGGAALAALLGATAAVLLFEAAVRFEPFPLGDLRSFPSSTRIVDAEGRILREVVNRDGFRARWLPLAEISPLLREATIAVEEILRVVPEMTAERAAQLMPGLEKVVSAQEFAQYPANLRKAGLP